MKTHHVFIASPSDVQKERNDIQDIIESVNRTTGALVNRRFQPFLWEHDAVPGFGASAQELINKQAINGQKMDAAIFILWHKFGTPTGKYESGWLSEFTDFVNQKEKDPLFKIMFFIKSSKVNPRNINGNQLQKINDFLNDFSGLYNQFDRASVFRSKVEAALASTLKDFDLHERENRRELE